MVSALWLLWRYKALIGMAALGLYIGWQALSIAHLEAKLAGAEADVKVLNGRIVEAQHAVAAAKNANDNSVRELDRLRALQTDIVRAMEREIAAVKNEKQQVQIVRKVIREQVEVCPPMAVPPGIGAAAEWLRGNPDPGAGAPGVHRDQGRKAGNP